MSGSVAIGQPEAMERELAQRESDGISVTLLWDSESDRLTVSVDDRRTGESFELHAQPQSAMDVFRHPYAYAASRGRETAAREPVYA
jgi:hypothetical protein